MINGVLAELLSHGWLKSAAHFKVVDSTNSAAKRFALATANDLPALFVADEQTHGRGRGGHTWWSPSGCLMMTLAVTAKMLPEKRELWSQLALLVGVGSAEAIERVCPELDIQLKWPNDLYLSGRKLGGILIESFKAGKSPVANPVDEAVSSNCAETIFAIGIGINVAMNWPVAPQDISARATCLTSGAGRLISIDELLFELIMAISRRIDGWRCDGESWFDVWHSRCLLSGKIVAVNRSTTNLESKERLVGRCEGVASDGRLLVRTEDGSVTSINVGEVVSWQ